LCFRDENCGSIRLIISLSDTVGMKVGPVIILILVLFTFNFSRSQARHGKPGSSAQSSLTVTATVEPSVWLVMEPDGKRDVVVANAPDPKDSFSHRSAKPHRTSAAKKEKFSIAKSQEPLQKQDDTGIHFDFPTVSRQFDVTRQTVMMSVSEGVKRVARPVTITTVVAQ
jgi:hypothetical protein